MDSPDEPTDDFSDVDIYEYDDDIAFRNSLLFNIEDRNRTLNKKGLIHRMVVISKYKGDVEAIKDRIESVFRESTTFHQVESVTGLLLFYPNHCVHVVETSHEVLVEFCKELYEQELNQGFFVKSKILVLSHDIPQRLYRGWLTQLLDIEAPRIDDFETGESSEKLVSEILVQLLNLGMWLYKNAKAELSSLHQKIPEFLPQQDMLGYLVEKCEDEWLANVGEFANIYEEGYDFTLNSDLTWPASEGMVSFGSAF